MSCVVIVILIDVLDTNCEVMFLSHANALSSKIFLGMHICRDRPIIHPPVDQSFYLYFLV